MYLQFELVSFALLKNQQCTCIKLYGVLDYMEGRGDFYIGQINTKAKEKNYNYSENSKVL